MKYCAGLLIGVGLIVVWFTGCSESRAVSLDPVMVQEFFEAVSQKNRDRVDSLLAQERDLVYARNDLGATPLMKAARYGEPDMVELLLKAKPDVDAQTDTGATALLRTAEAGKTENAALLLRHGADPDIKEASQAWAPIQCAAYYGRLEIIKLLVQHKADVNATGKYGQTALHWSMRAVTWENQKEIAEFLITSGVKVNHKDKKGKTALQMAARRSSEGVPELLRKHGAQ